MIVAIGHDLIEVERIRGLIEREPHRLGRLFTPQELEYCWARADYAPSFAARFAAKEAFQKVWPRPHGWTDVWVQRERTPDGPFAYAPPVLGFAPALAQAMQARGLVAHLTLTHTREHASAVVVLEQVKAPASEQ